MEADDQLWWSWKVAAEGRRILLLESVFGIFTKERETYEQ